ncbi:MAG: hypothetical protein KAI71_06840 [Candidatus Pacebacteria bacterium]|nr:hypothetical protein [Candidatus Paceibacterota bacterium]
MRKPISKADKIAEEINNLYAKAKTRDEYKLVAEMSEEVAALLSNNEEIISKTINSWWAQYYLFLKFDENYNARKLFVEKIARWYKVLEKPENIVKFGYLYVTAVANLTPGIYNREIIEVNAQIKDVAEKTGNSSLILQAINSRGVKEMVDKNWLKAEEIFSEINPFYMLTLKEANNLLLAANILNNRGATLIRGDINAVLGAIFLLDAAEFYSRLDQPPAKHFQGLVNRLEESLDKIRDWDKEIITARKVSIIALIEEAKILLRPMSDKVHDKQVSRECLDTLICKMRRIREKIINLNT